MGTCHTTCSSANTEGSSLDIAPTGLCGSSRSVEYGDEDALPLELDLEPAGTSNRRSLKWLECGAMGTPPIVENAREKRWAALKSLIDHKSDVNEPDGGIEKHTALYWAVKHNHEDSIASLLCSHADPQDSVRGKTLIEVAQAGKCYTAEKMLSKYINYSQSSPRTNTLGLNLRKDTGLRRQHGVEAEGCVDDQKHYVLRLKRRNKEISLRAVLCDVDYEQAVVFTNRNYQAAVLQEETNDYLSESIETGILHQSDSDQSRQAVLAKMMDAVLTHRRYVLFCTDHAHVQNKMRKMKIPLVINYDFPEVPQYQYLTRANSAVCVINFIRKCGDEARLLTETQQLFDLHLYDMPTAFEQVSACRPSDEPLECPEIERSVKPDSDDDHGFDASLRLVT